MATSGTYNWQLTAENLIDSAARKLSVVDDGGSLTSTQKTAGLEALNSMLKLFQTKGMPLWAIHEQAFPLTATRTYTIGIGAPVDAPPPLKILQAYLKDTLSNTSIPLAVRTRQDYNNNQPVSTTTGTPIEIEHEPGILTSVLHVWPVPDAYSIANRQIVVVYQRPFQDVAALTDTIDFPSYWSDPVIYGLAVRLAPEFGIPIPDRQALRAEAKEYLDEALSFGTEEGSLYLQPDWQGRK